LLAALGDERLPAALAGETTGTVAVAGTRGDWVANEDVVKCFVPEADRVDWIAVVDAGPTVRVVPAADVPVRLVETIDWSRRLFEVDTVGVSADPQPLDRAALETVLRRGTVTLAAEMVGTARRIFDMTLEYAKERKQFDVPIGSFQAIQHKLADVSLAIERSDSATVYAAMALDDQDPDAPRATHVAKAAAGRAATRAAKDGIQVHGGIGYTWEHDLHLFLRRAFGSEYWLGTTTWHHDRLADLLFD
ncbi:MAG TPA: acyl-CoA dehydrogenase family protein, partial [Acidimicrobiia bacterium]|nr:acyl-CoA dehydrogenase family protein [Acidimicrobiia bacterium]